MQNDPAFAGIAFNQLSGSIEVQAPLPWPHTAKYWRDADDAQLVSYIGKWYLPFMKWYYDVAVTKVADDRSYHPILKYLSELPDWDGTPRLDTLLVDMLGAEDCPYVRAVTRKTLCAAVARVWEPGVKFDSMLVLRGPQGIGKSTLIAKLGGEWFSDSLHLNDTRDKRAAEKLQGYWLLEIGELAGLKKSDLETLRGFLTRQDDVYRNSYGRRATPHPRQCVFIGTTNATHGYLRDTTGNRRFWPVHTPGGAARPPWRLTAEEVDQIWAEAQHYLQSGEQLYLPQDLEEVAREEQQTEMEVDEREGLVREYLSTLLPQNWPSMSLYERRCFLDNRNPGEAEAGTERRTLVSNIEIWCECFRKERGSFQKKYSHEISAIMAHIEGWIPKDSVMRISIYGVQRVYEATPM
jgi:predicted P-loop ATPase